MRLGYEEMWKAVVDCDNRYDGKFLYAVKTVGVYCHPSCKSRTPLQKNTVFFDSAEEAVKSGCRPCKRCRPDLHDYAPGVHLARSVKVLIDQYFNEKETLRAEIRRLGVSAGHLAVVFKEEYGMVPGEYLNKIRIDYAKKLLAETDVPIIDVAGDTGFGSLASFYRIFKRQTGTAPKEYRLKAIGQR